MRMREEWAARAQARALWGRSCAEAEARLPVRLPLQREAAAAPSEMCLLLRCPGWLPRHDLAGASGTEKQQ